MAETLNVRWGWLKFMYIYTIVGAGGLGLGMLTIPDFVQSAFRFPVQDPVIFGLVGSIYATLGLVSIAGLKSPLRFASVLLLQLCYKVVWVLAVVLPLFLSGQFPLYVVLLLVIFATYIIGDLIAIPFSYVLSKSADTESNG